MGEEYVRHPLIKEGKLELREYQVKIARECLKAPTLVILATGLGKTPIALMVIAERLYKNKGTKALFMAPTRPLIEQHKEFASEVLKVERISCLSGEIPPYRRDSIWKNSDLLFATPQVVQNDVERGSLDLSNFSVLVFDEAHRAVGDYAYVKIAKNYWEVAKKPLVLGLTASPGNTPEHIIEVCKNLGIVKIEYRKESDPDVAPYVHKRQIRIVQVELPKDALTARRLLNDVYRDIVKVLISAGLLSEKRPERVPIKEIVALSKELERRAKANPSYYRYMISVAAAMKVHHAIEMLDRQGPKFAAEYIYESILKGKNKTSSLLSEDNRIWMAYNMLKNLENPKIEALKKILEEEVATGKASKAIIFVEYRKVAKEIEEKISEIPGIRAKRFVGQGSREKDKGMSQREQVRTIEEFRMGNYNVLVATSVAEEGLDIPETDLVIFYEAVPSKVRAIQRKGRTGRKRPGEIVILVTKGASREATRDQIYYFITRRAERKISQLIYEVRPKIYAINKRYYQIFKERNSSLGPSFTGSVTLDQYWRWK